MSYNDSDKAVQRKAGQGAWQLKRVTTVPEMARGVFSAGGSAGVDDHGGAVAFQKPASFPSEAAPGQGYVSGSSTSSHQNALAVDSRRKPSRKVGLPPHQAMLLLKAGNERFVRGRPMAAPMDHQARFQLDIHQAPHTAVVGCADCPVPLETIFDAMPGNIFALRNAGNTCTHAEGSMMGSVEFCCGTLGSRLVVVLGHTHCRAVEGAARNYLERDGRNGEGVLMELMKSVEKAASELGPGNRFASKEERRTELAQAAVKVNVFRTINYLLQSSESIQRKVRTGELEVVAALFDNKTGRVEFMGKSPHEEMILRNSLPSSVAPLLHQGAAAAREAPSQPSRPSAGWALQKLTEGNARFALGTTLDVRSAQPEALYAAVVCCSDCTTSAEAIFDTRPGSLFVLPNVGNTFSQAESSLLGSLEFCTAKLNVPLILILGHRNCDAICSCARIAKSGKCQKSFGAADAIMADLAGVIQRASTELGPGADIKSLADHAIKVNVFHTMENLLRNSERLRELVRDSELEIQGAIFDKASGCVDFLGHPPNLDDLLRDQRDVVLDTETRHVSAEAALKLLEEGNQRWVQGTAVASRIPKAIGSSVREAPVCAVIGCADLRTPVEQIFDSMPGEIFVLRNAGNTITHAKGSMVTSLEFCTCKLMTKLILVLGHTTCMALSSAICCDNSCSGKASDALVQGICGAAGKHRGIQEISMEEAVELNILHTMDCLLQYSSCIREKVQAGELEIHGAVYDCATGKVRLLRANNGPEETLKGA